MLALVTLGFSKLVEETATKLNDQLLNEGLLQTCGDAWWDDGRFDHERIILAEILLRLGASTKCKNKFQKTPIEIAKCWSRNDLAKFLENPDPLTNKIPVTPNMLSANKKTGFSGLSSRTKKLIEKADRNMGVRIPTQHVRQQSNELKKELFSPPTGGLVEPPRLERRDSFHSLPAEVGYQQIREVEMKNLGATNRDKPIVTKGIPVKFKIPNCQIDLRPPQSESTPDLSRCFTSAPSSPNGSTTGSTTGRGVFGLVPTNGTTTTSSTNGHPVVRGQNKIEMKIGGVKPFTPSAPLKNYSLNALNP